MDIVETTDACTFVGVEWKLDPVSRHQFADALRLYRVHIFDTVPSYHHWMTPFLTPSPLVHQEMDERTWSCLIAKWRMEKEGILRVGLMIPTGEMDRMTSSEKEMMITHTWKTLSPLHTWLKM